MDTERAVQMVPKGVRNGGLWAEADSVGTRPVRRKSPGGRKSIDRRGTDGQRSDGGRLILPFIKHSPLNVFLHRMNGLFEVAISDYYLFVFARLILTFIRLAFSAHLRPTGIRSFIISTFIGINYIMPFTFPLISTFISFIAGVLFRNRCGPFAPSVNGVDFSALFWGWRKSEIENLPRKDHLLGNY